MNSSLVLLVHLCFSAPSVASCLSLSIFPSSPLSLSLSLLSHEREPLALQMLSDVVSLKKVSRCITNTDA